MKNLKVFGISMGVCYFIILCLFLSIATIFAYTNIEDTYIDIFIYAAIFIATFVTSLFLNKKIKERGLVYGGLFGVAVIGILYLIAIMFIPNVSLTMNTLIILSISTVSSMLGGIIGVNL